MKVLLVDDDPDTVSITTFVLQRAGLLVVEATDGVDALESFANEQPDIAILDVNLPRRNGLDVVRAIRRESNVPIIMLTGRDSDDDVVLALDVGADDYLTKPFSPRVLVARVRALLRRAGARSEDVFERFGLVLDMERLTLEGLRTRPIDLTRLEMRIFQLLLANAGRPVASERILQHVWGAKFVADRQQLKQLVHRLRNKLETDPTEPRLVRTIPNSGYYFDPDGLVRSHETVEERKSDRETDPHDDLQRNPDP